jgi:phosphocarrier protein
VTEKTAQIVNPLGLHARPAAQFVKLAGSFSSHVEVGKDGAEPVNGKSIMGVMMLAAESGSTLTIRADGPDEQVAVDALCALVNEGFGEL